MDTAGGRCCGLDSERDPEFQALRERYVHELKAGLATATQALRPTINRLVDVFGVNRATLLEWGTAVGFSRGYVRTILSEILCAKGKRARAPGAGPKTSELAKEWYTRAEQEIGAEMAWRVLNSASRWGKALEAQRASGKIVALPERQTIQRKAS